MIVLGILVVERIVFVRIGGDSRRGGGGSGGDGGRGSDGRC